MWFFQFGCEMQKGERKMRGKKKKTRKKQKKNNVADEI